MHVYIVDRSIFYSLPPRWLISYCKNCCWGERRISIIEGRLHDRKEMWVLNIKRKYFSILPAPYSANQRWRVIWFVHILQNSGAEVSFSWGICERTVERYISRFLMNGHVKSPPVSCSYDSISFAPREELIAFAHQIWKSLPLAVLSNSVFWTKCMLFPSWWILWTGLLWILI